MTKSKYTPAEQVARQQAKIEKIENEIKRLKHRQSAEQRRARTHRLVRLGGEIESRVGRELTETEAVMIANVAHVLLEGDDDCMGQFGNTGNDVQPYFVQLAGRAAHVGEQSFQRRKAEQVQSRRVGTRAKAVRKDGKTG